MDMDTILANLPIILLAIALIVVQILRRRKPKEEKTPREIVLSLLGDVGRNLSLVESFHLSRRVKKFATASWQRNRTRIDFLDESLQGVLTDAFMIAEDFNQQIEVAKKQKSAIYVASIDVDRLKAPLTKSGQELEQWLVSNFGTKQPPLEYPSITDYIFGGRTRKY